MVDGIRQLLENHPSVQRESVRVRFVRLGEYSLDIDVFAYVSALDWNHFLEVQETLLFGVTEVVEAAGTGLAFRGYHVPRECQHASRVISVTCRRPSGSGSTPQTSLVSDFRSALRRRSDRASSGRQGGDPSRSNLSSVVRRAAGSGSRP